MKNYADIVTKSGKTIREENMGMIHNIPLGTDVKINAPSLDEHLLTGQVIKHCRDCDGTPLYGVKFYAGYEDYGYSEESLQEVEQP